jgi:CheY-like chemotaxis protein
MSAKGLKVFVVEDEPMISMLVADMLEDLGCQMVAEAGDIETATKLALSQDFDLAILDVNVKGQTVFAVAELIQARGLPFIFATGYGAEALPARFRDQPVLQKPFEIDALAKAIEGLWGPRGS